MPAERKAPHRAGSRRVLHCWADGPRLNEWTDQEVGTTCMLEAGHAGEHQWTRDDQIRVTFGPAAPEVGHGG